MYRDEDASGQHDGSYGESVGICHCSEVGKGGHDDDSADHERPVDSGDVHLALHGLGCVCHSERRETLHYDELLEQTERRGDQRLGGYQLDRNVSTRFSNQLEGRTVAKIANTNIILEWQ